MVEGIDSFINRFAEYSDCYTIIGGAACDILMSEADVDFRATHDVDMIVIMESRYQEFAKVFWEYVLEGGYRFGWKSSDEVHFYRFTEPRKGFPSMIELFSRKPDYVGEVPEGIVPMHIDDEISSLSAILLNDDFYEFMLTGRRIVSGACVLDAEHIIPFKMFAWLNLRDLKSRGEHVNDRDLKKHKNDVFRLLRIVDRGKSIETTGLVRESIVRFVSGITEEKIPFEQLGLPFGMDEALEYLGNLYSI